MKKFLTTLLIITILLVPNLSTFGAATDIKNDATLSTGLISCWLSDTSGLLTDLVTGTGNDLTNNNTVTLGVGLNGDAADFESGSSQHLSIADGDQTGLDLSTDFSFSFWVKTESSPAEGLNFGFPNKWGSSGNRSYLLNYLNAGSSVFKIRSIWQSSSSGTTNHSADFTLNTATWYHIVAAVDISVPTTVIYVDNDSKSINNDGSGATTIRNSVTEFAIGSYESGQFMDGLIHQVCVWSKVLSSGEVSDLYNAGAGIPFEGAVVPSIKQQSIFNWD